MSYYPPFTNNYIREEGVSKIPRIPITDTNSDNPPRFLSLCDSFDECVRKYEEYERLGKIKQQTSCSLSDTIEEDIIEDDCSSFSEDIIDDYSSSKLNESIEETDPTVPILNWVSVPLVYTNLGVLEHCVPIDQKILESINRN